MDPLFKNRIEWWHLLAKKQEDHWIRFILYYIIFDAYLTNESQASGDMAKIRWFIDNENSLKTSFSGCWKTKLLPQAKALKSFSPIRDMRPGSRDTVVLKDETNVSEVIRFIYQIRSNLFHGSKDRMDDKDSSLVFHGGEFLREAIDWWLVSTR